MGKTFVFSCTKCSYKVKTSGGEDRGMAAFSNTYICSSCKIIVDITERVLIEREKIIGKSFFGVPKIKREVTFREKEIICPDCHNKTSLEKWDNINMPCPKCDGKMEKGSLIGLWD